MERIGVIGLGRMGSAIAARLGEQGVPVTGWTRSGLTEARADELWISAAPDLAALTAASDVIITSLYDDAAVGDVLDALANHDLSGKLIIDTSTIVPATLHARAEAIAAKGAALVDAPIAGGPEMVANGTCVIVLGAAEAQATRALAALAPITDKRQHVGPLGAGLTMKCINNAISQVFFVGLCEQLRLAKRAGLPLEKVLDVILAGHAAPPFLIARRDKILGLNAEVGFPIDGLLKDNAIFQRSTADQGVAPEGLALAGDLLRATIEDGQGAADIATLFSHAYNSA